MAMRPTRKRKQMEFPGQVNGSDVEFGTDNSSDSDIPLAELKAKRRKKRRSDLFRVSTSSKSPLS